MKHRDPDHEGPGRSWPIARRRFVPVALFLTVGFTPVRGQTTGPTREAIQRPASREIAVKFRAVDTVDSTSLPDVMVAVANNDSLSTTGRDGLCSVTIRVPRSDATYTVVHISKAGYVPLTLFMTREDLLASSPGSVLVPLERGISVGGLVRSAQGNPISGARVALYLSDDPAMKNFDTVSRLARVDNHSAVTDEEGRWVCDSIPPDLGARHVVLACLTHPGYRCDPLVYSLRMPVEELLARTNVTVMEKGVPLSGRVVDAAGGPIAGALLLLKERYSSPPARDLLPPDSLPYIQQVTGPDGLFEFAHLSPGPRSAYVEAPNYVSQHFDFEVVPSSPPVEIRLRNLADVSAELQSTLELQEAEDREHERRNAPERWIMRGLLLLVGVLVVAQLARYGWERRRREK